MIKIWGRRSAYNVQKVLWTVGEVGLAYEHIDAGGAAGGLDNPEFLAMNPHRRIPVVVDNGVVLWESNTIVRYLAATYGLGSLWLEDPARRSLADRWMDWELATLQPDFMALFWGFFRTPEAQRDNDAIERASGRCADHFRILDSHLSVNPYLAGTVFTMGDIPVATALYRYFEMDLPVPRFPNVQAWYQRLQERTAYRDHIAVPFEELRGRVVF
ncbi:MAG: glutathione S-transferase [Gammaproteobacteria bacterium]|nr:glutathione S-transferase [Gammaproteobacteria bacterium]